jgi:hypothetical protein
LVGGLDFLDVEFPLRIRKEIIDFYFVNIIYTQNPNETILLLRSENQIFTEVDEKIIKEYFRYVLLCKEIEKKTELLDILNIKFSLKDGTLSVLTEN